MTGLDDQIRDALRDRAGDVTGERSALGAIERGAVRARRRRAAVGGLAAVVLLASGVLAATRFVGSDDPGELITPPGNETPTPTSSLPWRDTETYSDPRGFTVLYPTGYERSVFEGHVSFRPPGLPSLEQGEPTFGVSFQIEAGANAPMDCQGEEFAKPGTDGTREVDGRSVPTCEQTGDDEGNWYRRTYSVAWREQTCDHISMGCPSKDAGVTLTIRIVGGTRELWDQHLHDGELIAESVRPSPPRPNDDIYEGSTTTPPPSETAPTPTITEAQATDFARRFLQARVRGEGAEKYMTSEARRTVQDLYAFNGRDYISSDIGEVSAADASSWEVSSQLFHNESKSQGVHEIVFVGWDEGEIKVRGVEHRALFTD